MGERCVIRFTSEADPATENVAARVYLHRGGETFEDVAATMRSFMRSVSQLPDPRMDDPACLAAKFVVWDALSASRSAEPLDFLGVGVVESDDYGDYVGTFCCGWPLRAYAGPDADSQLVVAKVGAVA